jgi:hypothetical protein
MFRYWNSAICFGFSLHYILDSVDMCFLDDKPLASGFEEKVVFTCDVASVTSYAKTMDSTFKYSRQQNCSNVFISGQDAFISQEINFRKMGGNCIRCSDIILCCLNNNFAPCPFLVLQLQQRRLPFTQY